MMDRQISAEKQRGKKNKKYMKLGGAAVAVIAVIVLLITTLKPSIRLDEHEISTAEIGSVDVSVAAVGSVVPYYQEVLTSPISTKILNVYKHSGEHVEEGDAILELDLTQANVDMKADRVNMDIRRQRLELAKAKVARELTELRSGIDIEQMRLKRMAVLLDNEKYLDSIGASTKDQVRQNEMNYEIAQLQFEQQKARLAETERTNAADIRIQEMEFDTAWEQFQTKQKKMSEALVMAPRAGTLSFVNEELGSAVSPGGKLAVLSDLSRFKVDAEVSESFADRLTVGNKAEVKVGNRRLEGTVANVVPAVENGRIKFTVTLDEAGAEGLRTGLKVDVYVVHSLKDNVLRIANGAYYSGAGTYDLWVIEGGSSQNAGGSSNGGSKDSDGASANTVRGTRAVKRKVELGESSSSHVEVLSGLAEKDAVIISSMTRHNDKTRLRIK